MHCGGNGGSAQLQPAGGVMETNVVLRRRCFTEGRGAGGCNRTGLVTTCVIGDVVAGYDRIRRGGVGHGQFSLRPLFPQRWRQWRCCWLRPWIGHGRTGGSRISDHRAVSGSGIHLHYQRKIGGGAGGQTSMRCIPHCPSRRRRESCKSSRRARREIRKWCWREAIRPAWRCQPRWVRCW